MIAFDSSSPVPGSERRPRKPRLGVFKMASCDGCQLTLLDCEDELLAIAGAVDIVHFPEASSDLAAHGPFDLVLVEGSVSVPAHIEEIRAIRAATRVLVTIGACATTGGIQALRNFADSDRYVQTVYAQPSYIQTLATSTPISAHVPVDFQLRGCPIDKHQLLELIIAYVHGRKPQIKDESVCLECKRRGNVCVMVTRDEPCLGPVTHTGCGALCPTFARGCFGCFGPREQANTRAVADHLLNRGSQPAELRRRFRMFTGYAAPFAEESERHG